MQSYVLSLVFVLFLSCFDKNCASEDYTEDDYNHISRTPEPPMISYTVPRKYDKVTKFGENLIFSSKYDRTGTVAGHGFSNAITYARTSVTPLTPPPPDMLMGRDIGPSPEVVPVDLAFVPPDDEFTIPPDLKPPTMRYHIQGQEYLNFSQDCGNGFKIYAGRLFNETETYNEFDHWKCVSAVKVPNFFILTQIWFDKLFGVIGKQNEKFALTPDGYKLEAVHLWCYHVCGKSAKNLTLHPKEFEDKIYEYDEKVGRENSKIHEFYYLNTTRLLELHPDLTIYVSKPPEGEYEPFTGSAVSDSFTNQVLYLFCISFSFILCKL